MTIVRYIFAMKRDYVGSSIILIKLFLNLGGVKDVELSCRLSKGH